MTEIKAVLFDVYGTLIDIHTDEHRDDIFDSLSRFLEYRQVYSRIFRGRQPQRNPPGDHRKREGRQGPRAIISKTDSKGE